MKLRYYALTAVGLFVALGWTLSQPISDPVAIRTDIVPDTIALSRSEPAFDLSPNNAPLSAVPVADRTAPVLPTQALSVASLLTQARDQGASDQDIQALLATLAQSGQLHGQPVKAANQQSYTVKQGDSLASIALEIYGTTAAFPALFAANRAALRASPSIEPGLVLRLP